MWNCSTSVQKNSQTFGCYSSGRRWRWCFSVLAIWIIHSISFLHTQWLDNRVWLLHNHSSYMITAKWSKNWSKISSNFWLTFFSFTPYVHFLHCNPLWWWPNPFLGLLTCCSLLPWLSLTVRGLYAEWRDRVDKIVKSCVIEYMTFNLIWPI